ncbi:beta-N-acetylhexosaminidase [Jannaschia pagri]|uniref:beta-N-acetylhexosaminidase n=1 Tax=Jannaschia pagri TaxID=2829797 RepID=A0ABQ4NG91_9RHOB|nr:MULTISPECIES: glycoside hydrolase family 3 N-terminal domain-containing protein [unclassified Jannaschia]GIT90447.1 beta-N-acetylhexosaminidase [Jannaschia sp. AI_61]GIT93448.1 beta-N-acetylhexosaminidase [Jannaschia sp. AI_62]
MAGAFILGCDGPDLTPSEAAFFREADPWGFILFARNVTSPERLRALTANLREAVGRDAVVLVDQEGGRVQRLSPPFWSGWVPPLTEMARAKDPERAMFLRATLIARELREVGIDVNCTPTADIAGEGTHPFLLNRLYGHTVQEVVARARANAEGCLQGGVLPVMKHIPGHGRATTDSHLSLPKVQTPRAELARTDFEVFRQLADLPLGMTAHVVYADIDAAPGTISGPVHRVIRDDIGFDGLLMTDDISMGALPGDIASRCAASIAAGCDVVLHCNGTPGDMEVVAATCPQLEGTALLRADRALQDRRPPVTLDIAAARAEFQALTA